MDTDWNKILFSDECSIRISGSVQKRWTKRDKTVIQRTVKYPLKMNIWGYFIDNNIGSIDIFSENMDSIKYIEILENNILPIIENTDENLIFQHDNDPKHTAKITKAFLKNNNISVLEWPACSPDLNPIENVWNLLKIKIHKRKPKDKDEFIDIITEEWLKFDSNVLKSLINSMPKRIQQVIKNNGDIIMY